MSDMARQRLARVEELFATAKQLPLDQRDAFLAQHCAQDAALEAEVRQYLALDFSRDTLLDHPADPWIGRTLDRWRIVRRIGAGGMGVVYLAQRDDGVFQQTAALKLLKHGLDRAELIERFRQERQVLAALSHPSIARLIDGGATPEGIPWFVMEYVKGRRIDEWCDERRLSLAGRLELFRIVCAAVHYAHQNLVVHRDIKPSNILVCADGTPMLVDFGISKVLEVSAKAAETRPIERRLTPEYAAPEVIRGGGVNTSSDIFSLGVLLHELLSGNRPWRLSEASVSDLERAICNTSAPLPSAGTLTRAAAEARGLSAGALRRALRGDLDAIVAGAIAADPQRRYASAQALANDVGRSLTQRPVQARPATAAYVFGRFVRRKRALSFAVGLGLLALALGALGVAKGVRAERHHAEATQRVNRLLSDMLVELDPANSKGFSNAFLKQLDAAVKRLDDGLLSDDPAAERDLRAMLGRTFKSLGYNLRASKQLGLAIELARRTLGTVNLRVAALLRMQGSAERMAQRPEIAVVLLGEALALSRQLAAVAPLDEARATRDELVFALHDMGLVLPALGRYEEAQTLLREALTLRISLDGDQNESAAGLQNALAFELLSRGDALAAEPLARAGFELRARLYPQPDPRLVWSSDTLADVLLTLGRAEEALVCAERGLELCRKLFDPQAPPLARGLSLRGRVLTALGHHAQAAGDFQEALGILRLGLEPDSVLLEPALLACGLALADSGDLTRARPLLEEALQLAGRNPSGASQARARAATMLAR
jgi:serine/threonine-protein kinase